MFDPMNEQYLKTVNSKISTLIEQFDFEQILDEESRQKLKDQILRETTAACNKAIELNMTQLEKEFYLRKSEVLESVINNTVAKTAIHEQAIKMVESEKPQEQTIKFRL